MGHRNAVQGGTFSRLDIPRRAGCLTGSYLRGKVFEICNTSLFGGCVMAKGGLAFNYDIAYWVLILGTNTGYE
jgi:hypothetical protein